MSRYGNEQCRFEGCSNEHLLFESYCTEHITLSERAEVISNIAKPDESVFPMELRAFFNDCHLGKPAIYRATNVHQALFNQQALDQVLRKENRNLLLRLKQHGHGGGNWRRLVESELAELDEDRPK